MDPKNINLFVFDTQENFERSKRFLGEEGSTFKRMVCVESAHELETQFNLLNDNEYVFLVVHVFYTDKISGIKRYMASGIAKNYLNIGVMYISDGDSKEIKHNMVDEGIPNAEIYKYHQVQSNLEEKRFKVYTKREIINFSSKSPEPLASLKATVERKYPFIKYAIITALFEDEFEELKKVFDFSIDDEIRTATKVYHRGFLKTDRSKEIVAAIPNATGMVDSSIIATQMLEFFNPEFLIMSGVCGGSMDYNLGDIIIANQIFTFQKGKLSNINTVSPDGKLTTIDLFDKDRNKIDYNQLYDENGNQISVSIEKFEKEQDALLTLNTVIEDSLRGKIQTIQDKINALIKANGFFHPEKVIKIALAPIACSTMVINKDGYFEDVIKDINRKTAAVEMESYGVARACHFANEGKTIPIVFKSVMDHTFKKSDVVDGFNAKKFAAYTSSLFMKFLFDEKVI